MNPLLLPLHFYAGVLVAPFLAVAALTGMLFVFTPRFDALAYPQELRVANADGATGSATNTECT